MAERLDRVAHRGPDAARWRTFESPVGPVHLGHRRLAIIDLSRDADQPLAESGDAAWIILNGEIYNHDELRGELERLGFRFRTRSDTEVVLAAWRAWGGAAFARFVGMFALVIWDDIEKRLISARDRFGIKPLYWRQTPLGIAIGSEIKQLHDLEGGARIDRERAFDFLAGGVMDHTERTLLQGVRQLRGGAWMEIPCGSTGRGITPTIRRWHTPAYGVESSSADAVRNMTAHLVDAVRLHLVSDAPVGACLSGGLDSSALVAHAARLSGERLLTITAGYPGAGIDETRYASAMAASADVDQMVIEPSPEALADEFERMVWIQDEPFGSTSILAQWSVFAAARAAGLKVMLDGQGADDVLGGYRWLLQAAAGGAARACDWREANRLVAGIGQSFAWLAAVPYAASDGMIGRMRAFSRSGLDRDPLRATDGAGWPLQAALAELSIPRPHNFSAWRLVATYALSLPALLHWADRCSMAHGVEARVPFLDHRLAEWALSLPVDSLVADGRAKTCLRDSLIGLAPQSVIERRDKIGFATPEAEWLRGPLRPLIAAGVEAALIRFPDFFDRTGVARLVSSANDGQYRGGFALWRIASFGHWARVFAVRP